ncbi:MAG: recombinase [Clostridiales bacterium]|nr:recombinase [Clostridiales bacterium]
MKRTISVEVGKGSVNHNSRKFRAENVDGNRTHLNIDYCNERIQAVYHQLFDEALKRYNEKQARADRRISNYYEKIRSGNQGKPFHEIILQIGNKEDMSATGEYAELARTVLDKYYQGFQERNPNLRVFSAHLHMDEATPHIHIDFVPFTTGSKRGLDTRVSLKQALAAQGFKGGTRGATEWAQWVQSEKKQLAAVMERYDIQCEQKGTHEKHLSVLDYKKQKRVKEIAALDAELAAKQDEFQTVQNRIVNYDNGTQSIERLEQQLETEEFQLPEPSKLMTAKTYKQRFVDPLIQKLKEVIKEVFYRYYKAIDSYHRLNSSNGRLYRENEHLTAVNDRLKGENDALRSELKDFRFLRKVLGSRQIDNLIAQAKDMEQQRKQNQRTRRRNTQYER